MATLNNPCILFSFHSDIMTPSETLNITNNLQLCPIWLLPIGRLLTGHYSIHPPWVWRVIFFLGHPCNTETQTTITLTRTLLQEMYSTCTLYTWRGFILQETDWVQRTDEIPRKKKKTLKTLRECKWAAVRTHKSNSRINSWGDFSITRMTKRSSRAAQRHRASQIYIKLLSIKTNHKGLKP